MTSAILAYLHPSHRVPQFAGDYQTALPYIRDAFERALTDIAALIPTEARDAVISLIRCLCDPDPRLRGSLAPTTSDRFFMERVVSAFDLLARKAEYRLF